jgi:hypothetical protein
MNKYPSFSKTFWLIAADRSGRLSERFKGGRLGNDLEALAGGYVVALFVYSVQYDLM